MKDSAPANDAQLIQLVRSRLGRNEAMRDIARLNVSSCGFVVTLHGVVESVEAGREVGEAVGGVPGVEGVVNRLTIRGENRADVVS